MIDVWVVVIAVGAATIAFKAAGPVLLGARELSGRTLRLVELLAPVMLTALVVTQTFSGDGGIALDWRVPGIVAGGLALVRGVPLVPSMVVAGLVTALLRLVA